MNEITRQKVAQTAGELSDNTQDWESGTLGRDEQYVKRVDGADAAILDDALGMQMISIRLQKGLLDDLKFIAKANGIGYQPLMRDVLQRFVVGEVKNIVRETQARREREQSEATPSTDNGGGVGRKKAA
jgi:predicted RNA-binding protein